MHCQHATHHHLNVIIQRQRCLHPLSSKRDNHFGILAMQLVLKRGDIRLIFYRIIYHPGIELILDALDDLGENPAIRLADIGRQNSDSGLLCAPGQ